MMISVYGIGWMNDAEYGCVVRNLRKPCEDKMLLKKEILPNAYKNFGRIDNVSKMTCYASALALKDAGIEHSQANKQDIGIVGTSDQGSLETDMNYFRDYVDSSRTLARGNLFIYTLPTSSLGEAAIRFGLQGPVLYISASENSLLSVMDTAAEMILLGETPVMLAGMSMGNEAVYFILREDSGTAQNVLCSIDRARSIVGRGLAFNEMMRELSLLRKGNGHV
jgi:3-oxoacyl-[acyl-carrier-protein] synthase II